MQTWSRSKVPHQPLLRRVQPQLGLGLLLRQQQQGGERGGEQRLVLLLLVAHLRLLLLRLARLGELLGCEPFRERSTIWTEAQSQCAADNKSTAAGDHDDVCQDVQLFLLSTAQDKDDKYLQDYVTGIKPASHRLESHASSCSVSSPSNQLSRSIFVIVRMLEMLI